jgi:putative transposase
LALRQTVGPTRFSQIPEPDAPTLCEKCGLDTAAGKTAEWRSKGLRAYQRRTKQAYALIAGAYLGGTNTRRMRRALSAVFGGAISKDTVSRVWRKAKGDWEAWNARSLAEEPIIA